MFLFRRRKDPSDGRKKKTMLELEKDVERANLLNKQLQEKLAARDVMVGEYLYQYRTVDLPMLGSEWDLRYFVLSGQSLRQYKSAKDLVYNPREETSIMGCTVEWEGLIGQHWAFSITDPRAGTSLLRLSAMSKPVALKWVEALQAAGCLLGSGTSAGRLAERSASLELTHGAYPAHTICRPDVLRKRSNSTPRLPRSGSTAINDDDTASVYSDSGSSVAVQPPTSSQWSMMQRQNRRSATEAFAAAAAASASRTGSPPAGGKRPHQHHASGSTKQQQQQQQQQGQAVAHPNATLPAGSAGEGSGPGRELSPRGQQVGASKRVTLSLTSEALHKSQLGDVPVVGDAAVRQGGGQEEANEAEPPASTRKHHSPMLASTPVHTASRFSYLSSERMWHEKHSGLYNLAAVIMVVTNFRLGLENALKYGFRPFKLLSGLTIGNPNIPLALCYPTLLMLILLSLVTELLAHKFLLLEAKMFNGAAKKSSDSSSHPLESKRASKLLSSRVRIHDWLLFICNVVNTTASIAIPWLVISKTKAKPVDSFVLIMIACVLWMKLVSFHHVCWDLRAARREAGYVFLGTTPLQITSPSSVDISTSTPQESEAEDNNGSRSICGRDTDVVASAAGLRPGERGCPNSPAEWAVLRYPENLTLQSLTYFIAAPTLTYQVNFPRTETIRGKWLGRRVFELVIVVTALVLLLHQFIEPAIANSMKPLQQMDWLRIIERVLKLALPNMYAWLCMFYCLFHLWLNILAELLRFGDREFYKDWWNASTVGEYWRLWNMPVHKWLLRHVYYPSLRLGMSRWSAMVLVFFVSAVFHELILGVPLHMVRLWAFTGIMMQVPLIMISDKINKRLKSDNWGNIIFWLSFCVVGQPVTMLIYYHDFMKTQGLAAVA